MNEGKKPDFAASGVAVWVNRTQEGKQYLTIKILDSIVVRAFKNEPRPKPQHEPGDIQL